MPSQISRTTASITQRKLRGFAAIGLGTVLLGLSTNIFMHHVTNKQIGYEFDKSSLRAQIQENKHRVELLEQRLSALEERRLTEPDKSPLSTTLTRRPPRSPTTKSPTKNPTDTPTKSPTRSPTTSLLLNVMTQWEEPIQNTTETPRARVQIFNGTVCEISSKLKHVGVGYQGHVFSAIMNCPNGAMHVAVKVAARPKGLTRNFKRDTWVYKSLNNKDKGKSEALYERLMVNATHDIQNYFALTLGTADVPPPLLSDAVKAANQDSTVQAMFKELELEDHVLVCEVQEFVPGYPLDAKSGVIWTPETKHLIIKDLVRMFRHMYDRNVVHSDIFLKHVFFSPVSNQTKLIDFGYAFFVDSTKRRNRLQNFELWNLFSLIGNLCMHQENRIKPIFRKADHRTDSRKLKEKLIPALEKCNFNQTMVWNERSMVNTAETLQTLADWSSP